MLASLFVAGLVLVFILCVCLFKLNFKNYHLYYGGYFLGLQTMVIALHSVFWIVTYYYFDLDYFISHCSPFFMFYGVLYYFFIEGGCRLINDTERQEKIVFLKHLLLPGFFTTGYFFLILVSTKLDMSFTTYYFNFIYVVEGLLTIYYVIKVYRVLMVLKLENQSLRLHLLSINTILLFVGVMLTCFYFLDLRYFFFYKLWFVMAMLAILVYYICIIKSISLQMRIGTDCSSKLESTDELNVIKSTLTLKDDRMKTGNKVDDEVVIAPIVLPKYERSKLSEGTLKEYQNRINRLLVEKKMYLNPDLTLDLLSSETKISKHHLGQFFSTIHGKSFNRFINELRIAYLITYLDANPAEHFSVNDLLAVSPFKSRASFFRNFKEIKGVAPSDYLNSFYKE